MPSFGTSSGLQVVTFLSSDDLHAVLPNNERLCTLNDVCTEAMTKSHVSSDGPKVCRKPMHARHSIAQLLALLFTSGTLTHKADCETDSFSPPVFSSHAHG